MKLGPDNGTLTVRTGKAGAAAKAGHNLRMEVGSWSATLDLGDEPAASLTAHPGSFRVIEGTGGVMPLGDEEKEAIQKTIVDEVLGSEPIEFRSTSVSVDGDRIDIEGRLHVFGADRPVAFTLERADDRITGAARVTQSDWGVKPYSALFGTLKVADEVDIEVDARSSDDG